MTTTKSDIGFIDYALIGYTIVCGGVFIFLYLYMRYIGESMSKITGMDPLLGEITAGLFGIGMIIIFGGMVKLTIQSVREGDETL